jgi:hypothetical protein
MLLETGRADISTARTLTGAVASGWSPHAELTRTASSGMAAKLAAREVRADMRRIENLLDG